MGATLTVSSAKRSENSDGVSPARPPDDRAKGAARTRGGWRPGVGLVLVLVVLLPTVSTAVLTASSASSSWSSRQNAQKVASDAAQLDTVALARAQLNDARVPVMAVSFAESIGVSESLLSKLLGIDFASQITKSAGTFARNPVFTSTPTLKRDTGEFTSLIDKVEAGNVDYPTVRASSTRFAADVDSLWYSDYNRLQRDVETWRPPGTFEVHVSSLRQTYEAFLQGGFELEGTIYVLEGVGGGPPKLEVVQSAGNYVAAAAAFVGKLGPKATAQWKAIQASATDKQFQQTVTEAVGIAINGGPAPFASNTLLAGVDMRKGLAFLTDMNNLVRAGSTDLKDSATAQANHATSAFIGEVVFLVALVLVSIGGAVIAGRILTRPLKKLSDAAQRIHSGEFALEPLPAKGPREIVTTNMAFNDMASTLKGVEAKTMALATEDLDHAELQMPLPGRTGQALQVAVDKLSAAIRERELQRQQLHEAATHDALTSLLNRAAIFDFLTNDVDRRRQAGETVGVLFVDLNGLKQLNDTYGHEAGDAAICSTSEALLEAASPCDVVGRLGGDEFLVVLCHDHSRDSESSAIKMRDAVARRSVPVEGDLVPLSASVGLALTECDADTDPMELVRIADDAMYEAKRAARATRDHIVGR